MRAKWTCLAGLLLAPGLALAQAQAQAQTQAQPPSGRELFLQPVIGSNAITFGWTKSEPYLAAASFAPSLRGGLLLPSLSLDARLGLFTSGSLPGGYAGLSGLSLDLEAAPSLWTHGATRAYGLAGLGIGALVQVDPTASGVAPQFGLTLGLGFQHFLDPGFAVGVEVGERTQLSYMEPTTSVYIAFTGTWIRPFGWGLAPQNPVVQVPAAPGGVAASEPKDGKPHTPPEAPPTSYGHSKPKPCYAYVTDGWFEPTQGVWQDDTDFEDRQSKQLTRLPVDDVRYEAELNMAVGKDTVLIGVDHYRQGGKEVTVGRRDDIVLRGMSNCSVKVPVKLKFTLHGPGEASTLYTSPVLDSIPLEGVAGSKEAPWELKLTAVTGVPPDHTFKFSNDLPYRISAEAVRENGASTGLEMNVELHAVTTAGPKVHFIPVRLTRPKTQQDEDDLIMFTENLSERTARYTPDFYPLPPNGLPTFVKNPRDFSDQDIPSKLFESRRSDATVAALNDSLGASTFLDGAGRVVAVLPTEDFWALFGKGAVGMTVDSSVKATPKGQDVERWGRGRTLSWKVMLVPWTETWDTVAHELVHTLPEGWADSEMKSECGRAYHNQKDAIAHGLRITDGGVAGERLRRNAHVPLMGPKESESHIWMTQCTYWHLVHELSGGPPDPPVVLVRAFLSRDGKKGELRPFYDLMGNADLRPGKAGPWAFVLRDEKGAELGRYPFKPRFDDLEGGAQRQVASVMYRLPARAGLARVELVGPGGVLDQRKLSARAPSVQILSPAEGERLTPRGRKVHVTWKGEGEPGRTLLYSVSYSPDGGKNFLNQSFEQKDSAFDVTVSPKAVDPRVKVFVTDGTRSAEVVVPLLLQEKAPGK